MAEGSFTPINWGPNEIISSDKLQTIVDNVQWLRDNTLSGLYLSGVSRDRGLKIIAGTVTIPADTKSDTSSAQVNFPAGTFLSTTKPIVTATPVSKTKIKLFLTVSGIGTAAPESNGFRVVLNLAADNDKRDTLKSSTLCHWIAMGI